MVQDKQALYELGVKARRDEMQFKNVWSVNENVENMGKVPRRESWRQ